jgi:cell division septum initiation protein DivIVA
MPDEVLGPDRLTPKGLPTGRRGYDRGAVEELLSEARRAWAALEAEHRRLLEEIDRAGGLDYLSRDLGEVGADVGRVLGDAQETARGLRERARADSNDRLTAAGAAARRVAEEAQEQAFALRSDAWATGVEWLRQADEAAGEMIDAADAEVLVVRAGAEQEARRLIAAARKEAEDLLRAARFEAERSALEIRAQAAAAAPAETPAPPAKPLAPSAEEPAPTAERPVRRRWHRPDHEETPARDPQPIRVIRPAAPRRAGISDMDPGTYGDTLAAEVQALWESGEVAAVTGPEPEPYEEAGPVGEPEAGGPVEEAPASAGEAEVLRAEPSPEILEEMVPSMGEAEASHEEPVPEALADEVAQQEAGPVEDEGALPAQTPPEEAPSVGPIEPGPVEVPIPRAAGRVDELFTRLRRVPGSVPRRERAKTARPEPAAESRPAETPVSPLDAVALRDRLLLPLQNRSLRRVKECLLDLQNQALDSLRVAGSWEGEAAALAALTGALDPMAEEEAEAGARAVAAFIGGEPPAAVISTRRSALIGEMSEALVSQATEAATAAGEQGPLEVAGAASRVFRAWRSDEAERWVRTIAYAGYHDSLLAGLAVSGVSRVAPVAEGLLCGECPALRAEPWDPAAAPPPGTARPPAQLGCSCTVVPL